MVKLGKQLSSPWWLISKEFCPHLTQIEASRPPIPMPNDDDGIEALTPGHFLIGKPLMALPETTPTESISRLKHWQLRKTLLRHFWKHWSFEYITQLGHFNKWQHPTRNIWPGDLVAIHEDSTKWSLAYVFKVHPGKDNLATIKTSNGIYTRPISKLTLILLDDELW